MNHLTTIAAARGREYITPEDVTEAFELGIGVNEIRLNVLEVIGRQTDFYAEDAGLCAFIAWRGIADGCVEEDV